MSQRRLMTLTVGLMMLYVSAMRVIAAVEGAAVWSDAANMPARRHLLPVTSP